MKMEKLTPSTNILYDIDIHNFISSNTNKDLSIIYFSNHSDKNLCSSISNIISIDSVSMPSHFLVAKYIKPILRNFNSKEILIAIDIDDNVSFMYMKYLISNLIYLFKLFKQYHIQFNFNYKVYPIVSILSCSSGNPYFNDICIALKTLLINSKKAQYEIIYDYICKYLDDEFSSKKICGFCNNICDASRAGYTKYKFNGCCYTINYGLGGVVLSHTPCQYLVNGHCIANCISCKLHTCYFLRLKNIEYTTQSILLLNCFFSYKQHMVLRNNFFKKKEEIIIKLLHVNYIPSIFYYPLGMYKIN